MESQTNEALFSLPTDDITSPLTLTIPCSLLQFAEQQRDIFLTQIAKSESESSLLPAEVLTLFITHLAQPTTTPSQPPPSPNHQTLIHLLWTHLESSILGLTTDIHTLAAQLQGDESRQRRLIRTYFSARSAASMSNSQSQSALLRTQSLNQARIHGLFGGQGNNRHYFDELRSVWETYSPLVGGLLERLSGVLKKLSEDPRVEEQYPRGLDVLGWLQDGEATPEEDYLVSAPVSFPVIGVLQLVLFKAVCMGLGEAPQGGRFLGFLDGLAGHSQGVVVAAAVATAKDWEGFEEAAVKAVTILFWIGARCQQVFRQDVLTDEMAAQLEADGHGRPSPMLAVANLERKQLEKAVERVNNRLPAGKHAHLALVNATSGFVVSGPERTLAALIQDLQAISAKDSQSQARIPFSQRKPTPSIRFLPITIPCHCSLLDEAVPLIDSDLSGTCSIRADALRIPVNEPSLVQQVKSSSGDTDLTPLLVRLVTSKPVHWPSNDFSDATHIVDFGPGGTSGVGALTHRNLLGTGTRIIIAGKLSPSSSPTTLGSLPELFSPHPPTTPPNYPLTHSPTLLRTATGPALSTSLSRLLALPPIMVAGMTPTTCHPRFAAAVARAGYHVEFACGGYHSAAALKSALLELHSLLPPGRGITLNLIYAAPRQIAWQIPLVQQLAADGEVYINGLTIGGGVPTPEVASEYIASVNGLEHISFKPGSVGGIRQVVEIAGKNPGFPVILQWTGGRGGGHHSAEDMWAPVVETYGEIRARGNIVLVGGSGLGSAEDVVPLLTGEWSLAKGLGVKMPFDGVLVGSRVMTCKEAFTSTAVKKVIAAAKGVEDKEWEGTYKGPTGGVMSVVSEMGEPIHVIATRGARLWAEMDKTVFGLDRKKRPQVLADKKDYIIKRLNADFQRPWFGRKADGTACDIAEMTYAEVARRLIDLMFISGLRWIDKSHAGLLAAFLLRTEERFADEDGEADDITSEADCLIKPYVVLDAVLREYPLAAATLLCYEDVDYFTQLCRRPGQKPVPFVPALDENFETWFKKDSLWQSEDVEAVVDQDPERTFILHGPVAARHTGQVDEPVGQVLNGINRGVIERLMASVPGGESSLPYEEVIGLSRLSKSQDISPILVDAGSSSPWKAALFGSRTVARGREVVENPVRKLVDTLAAEMGEVQADSESVTVLTKTKKPLLQISKQGREIQVLVFTHVTDGDEPTSLELKFEYHPETPYAPIWEVTQERNERICAMYRQLWQGEKRSASCEDSFKIDAARVRAFNRAIGYTKAHQQEQVPMDFAIVVGWRPICSALLQDPVQGDVLNLVHLSNGYEVDAGDGRSGIQTLKIGDEVTTRAYISSITIEPSGKVVQIACEIRRPAPSRALIMTVRSSFLFRGSYTDFSSTFSHEVEPRFELDIPSETDIAILATKPWFRLDDGSQLDHLNLTDLTLEFHLETSTRWRSRTTYASLDTSGRVYIRSETGDLTPLGTVEYHEEGCRDNVVLSYLRRWGRVVDAQQTHPLQLPGGPAASGSLPEHKFEITIPSSNEAYSRASGDFNPIHTSPLFAGLVNLPGTITHGMYCSAAVRQVVEKHMAGANPDRIRNYKVSFVGMVLPNDVLEVSLCHSGMQVGQQVIDIVVSNKQTGAKVLTGSALVAQPSTTVVFTGQGSQEKGMGMQLYASSPVARAIWDQAEAYFESQFGVSILDVVRNNPKEIKVHFGGVKGRMLRQNYLAMSQYETVATSPTTPTPGAPSSTTRLDRKPLFPTVTPSSISYTHSSPNGLLFSTQFAQPALVIMELAAFKDMEARGVVDPDCHFAGHSLGEYAALVSTTGLMSFENLLYTVFCRGMTMQGAVERDAQGRSGYAMVAVDPSRVHKDFSEPALRALITSIYAHTTFFIEIVNLNIRNRQYVCAGDLRALDLLQHILDAHHRSPSTPVTTLLDQLSPSYTTLLPSQIHLRRGTATVPLSGVDVPFHSSVLRPRMEAFRQVLQESLELERIRPQRLVGKYVPNVTGTPFAIDKEYFERVWGITRSEALREVLDGWEGWEARVEGEKVAA